MQSSEPAPIPLAQSEAACAIDSERSSKPSPLAPNANADIHPLHSTVAARWIAPLLIGSLGWIALFWTRMDPGLTADEPFSVSYGKAFVHRLLDRGWSFFTRESITDTFGGRSEHPPFGRWCIGWIVWLQDATTRDSEALNFPAARVAPATAFAIMLVLVTRFAAIRYGLVGGVSAGLSLLFMPLAFGHAHLAALDTMVSWTFLMAVLAAGWMFDCRRPWLAAPAAGVLLGLALLTKMHGLLLLPLVATWAIACYGWRGFLPLLLWGAGGLVVFVAGWPWLWIDFPDLVTWLHAEPGPAREFLPTPFSHLVTYLHTTVDRNPIYVRYLGMSYPDSEVPRHYPWVMFGVTVPVGLLLLGVVGTWQHLREARRDRTGLLVLCAVLFPLMIFSIPRVPLYDGVRHFLMVFPALAITAGRGAGRIFDQLRSRFGPRWAAAPIAVFLAAQSYGLWHYHPFHLSYYNALVGGLRGADRRGFEVTYWGDTVTRGLVDEWSSHAGANSCAMLVPTLYPAHPLLYDESYIAGRSGPHITAWSRDPTACSYVIIYNREAYLKEDEIQAILRNSAPIFPPITRDGVWLSAVYPVGSRIPREKPAEPAAEPPNESAPPAEREATQDE